MSIYDDREISDHDGQPFECYEFIGTYKTYRYTSGDTTVVVAGNQYTPLSIRRGASKIGTHEQDDVDLRLTMPITVDLIRDYGFRSSPANLQLRIYRVHRGTNYATDYSLFWSGRVSTFSISGNSATVVAPSIFSDILAGSVPSVYYQTPCNHVLFDAGCKVSRIANRVVTTVVSVLDRVVTVADIGGFSGSQLVGGEIADVTKNTRRTIVAQDGNDLTVNYPFPVLEESTEVEITRGCNHAYNGDCKDRYNNQINHGGFMYIPTVNPFESGI